jgi:hypothetical protein
VSHALTLVGGAWFFWLALTVQPGHEDGFRDTPLTANLATGNVTGLKVTFGGGLTELEGSHDAAKIEDFGIVGVGLCWR